MDVIGEGRANEYLRSNLWPTGTRVQLLSVPWDAEYRDVIAWESDEARDRWFESHLTDAWVEVNFNYLWPGMPVTVPVPYSSAYRYNYLAVTNPAQPVDDEGPVRTYYYFIVDTQYASPQATRLTIQLDVITTYAGSINIGRSFVDRGHIGMANENASLDRNRYLTVPEGLDVGSQYQPVHTEFFNCDPGNLDDRYCIVVSTADLTADPGTTSKPNLDTAEGTVFDNIPNGCEVYAVTRQDLTAMMLKLSKKSWVGQCIIDIYFIPNRLIEVNKGVTKHLFGDSGRIKLYPDVHAKHQEQLPEVENVEYTVGNLGKKMNPKNELPEKMLCYPYTVIELSTLTGNPVYLKPELVNGNELRLLSYGQASPPGAQFCVFPANYERDQQVTNESYQVTDSASATLPWGSGLDNAVWITDFPHISIVNNQYQLYLASTTNTRAYNYQSAGWSLDKSNMSALNSYENAQRALGAEQTKYNASLPGLAANMADWVTGSPILNIPGVNLPSINNLLGGAVSALLPSQSEYAPGWEGSNIVNNLTGKTGFEAGQQASRQTADANLSLAKQVAKGDYQNAIAGINATVQDAALSAPSVAGQSGGNLFNVVNSMLGVRITVKQIAGAARETVRDYFRRYGYGVRRWVACGTMYHMLCMTRFAYWKLQETTVTCAAANETERMAIRGVFEKGVTLWADPDDIGNIDLSVNEPKPGYHID